MLSGFVAAVDIQLFVSDDERWFGVCLRLERYATTATLFDPAVVSAHDEWIRIVVQIAVQLEIEGLVTHV